MALTRRQQVVETLRMWASRDEQMEYRSRVPAADVSTEMFCLWGDVFWRDDATLRAEFSGIEWEAVLRFHSIFERVCRLLPHDPLPPIEQFVQSPHWLQLSRAAARALQTLAPAQDGMS